MQKIGEFWHPTVTDDAILGFFGEYRWLSNFHPCRVEVEDMIFPSSEHAYMAMKTRIPEERRPLTVEGGLTPGQAKRYGQKVTLQSFWDTLKDHYMLVVLRAKFRQSQELAERLLDTGEKRLEETNYWNDRYWGVCWGEGENRLGQLLMQVRQELRDDRNIDSKTM